MGQDEEYYKILEIDATATIDEIKQAYRNKVKTYHPDFFHNASEEIKEKLNEIMQKINEAYTTLSKKYYEIKSGASDDDQASDGDSDSPKPEKTKEHTYRPKKETEEDTSLNKKNKTRSVYIHMVSGIFEQDIFLILVQYMRTIYDDFDMEVLKECYMETEDKFTNEQDKPKEKGISLGRR